MEDESLSGLGPRCKRMMAGFSVSPDEMRQGRACVSTSLPTRPTADCAVLDCVQQFSRMSTGIIFLVIAGCYGG